MIEYVFVHRKTGEIAIYQSIFATLLYARMEMGLHFEYLGELQEKGATERRPQRRN